MNQQDPKKVIAMVVLLVAAVGIVIYQVMGSGGSTPAATPKAGTKNGAAAKTAAKTGAAAAPAASGPTRLTEVDINIDELLQGVREVTFDYETMRIDRDPLGALVGGPLKGDLEALEGGPLPVAGVGSVLQKKITGIIYDDVSPLAVVDDEVVGVGHEYPNGIKVHAIDRDKVTFQLGDSLIPVEMKEQ